MSGFNVKKCVFVGFVAGVAMSLGCSSPEKAVEKALMGEVEKCRAAEGDIYTARGSAGETRLLVEACKMEATEAKISEHSEHAGSLKTGPIEWRAQRDLQSKEFKFAEASWDNLEYALQFREAASGSQSASSYSQADMKLALALDDFEESGWLRLERVKNHVERLEATGADALDEDAQAYVDEVVAWAEGKGRAEVAQEAQAMAAEFGGE